jgi:hypothetical protein
MTEIENDLSRLEKRVTDTKKRKIGNIRDEIKKLNYKY